MTIQLTAPILEAGVEQATGTQLTLGADREAELVNRGVAVYTSRSPAAGEDLVQVLGRRNPAGGLLEIVFEGNSYAAIPRDTNGNAIANINLRRNTLAALLALDGGLGEISTASDWDAIVLHSGVANEAVIVACRPREAAHKAVAYANTIVSGTPLIPDLSGTVSGYSDYTLDNIDSTGFLVPAGANRMSVDAYCIYPANATGIRELAVLINGATPADRVMRSSQNAAASGTTTVSLSKASVIVAAGENIQLQLNQTSGGDLTPIGNSIFLGVRFWVQ